MSPGSPILRPPIDLWRRAHEARWRPGRGKPKRRIMVHATSGRGDARATAARWAGMPRPGEPATSAHFAIGQDGYVIQAVRLADIAQHAHGASEEAYGIELCAREPNELYRGDPGLPPSPAQLERAALLIAWLCRREGLPPTRAVIIGHAEGDPETTHTGCPTAAGVDLDALAADVAARLAV